MGKIPRRDRSVLLVCEMEGELSTMLFQIPKEDSPYRALCEVDDVLYSMERVGIWNEVDRIEYLNPSSDPNTDPWCKSKSLKPIAWIAEGLGVPTLRNIYIFPGKVDQFMKWYQENFDTDEKRFSFFKTTGVLT